MPRDAQVRLDATDYTLARDKLGAPIYKLSPIPFFPPQVLSQEATEAAFPPEARVPYSFRDLSAGFGQTETPIVGPNVKYERIGDAEGDGVDCSLSPTGPVLLGPALNTVGLTPAGTSNVLGVLWKGGTNTAYVAAGRYTYSWTGSTTFTNTGDLGVGNAATDAPIPFRGAQSSDYWYAPLGYSTTPKYSTDSGVTWTTLTNTGGIDNVSSMIVLDGEVVCAMASRVSGGGNAMLGHFDDGGTTPTLYGVIDPIGDAGFNISRLMVYQDRVVVLKDGEGVFVLAGDRKTLDQNALPELRTSAGVLNSYGAKVWQNIMWLPTSRGLWAVSPRWTVLNVSPGKEASQTTAGVRGQVQAVAGDANFLYAWLYVGAGAASWLLKAAVKQSFFGIDSVVWHPILQMAAGAQCKSMHVLEPGGNGPRLLMDRQTAAGANTVAYIVLAGNGRDPRADANYQYAAGGSLYYPRLSARFPATQKTFYGITPLCANLGLKTDGLTATTAQSVRQAWKADNVALTGSSPFGFTQGASQTTGSGVRDAFSSAVRARGLDVWVRLGSSDNTTSPQLLTVTPDYEVDPDILWQHEFTIDLTRGRVRPDGSVYTDPSSPSKALSTLRLLPAAGPKTLIDPWNNTYTVSVPLTGMVARAGEDRDVSAAGELPLYVDVKAYEETTIVPGTYQSLTRFTYGQLNTAGYLYSTLPTL